MPLLGLAPGGVYQATAVTDCTGALLPHHFTLTTEVAVSFLWHFPAGHPGLPLATTLLYGVRTFLIADLHRNAVSLDAVIWLTHSQAPILLAGIPQISTALDYLSNSPVKLIARTVAASSWKKSTTESEAKSR